MIPISPELGNRIVPKDRGIEEKEREEREKLEEVVTNIPQLFFSLIFFIFSHVRAHLFLILNPHSFFLLLSHPLATLLHIIWAPLVACLLVGLSGVVCAARMLGVNFWLEKISNRAYDSRSIANWGQVNVLKDRNISSGLFQITSPSSKSSFNVDVAKALLFLSSVIYEDEGSFEYALKSEVANWKNLKLKNAPGKVFCKRRSKIAGDFAAIFEVYNSTTNTTSIIVSFRGTSPLDLNQWLLDLSVNKVDANEFVFGSVHEGFFRTMFKKKRSASMNFYERLVQEIEAIALQNKLENIETHLWVTGHSLGGALASLFYARALKTKEIKNIILGSSYTFGSPRVGDLEFRNQFVSLDNSPFYKTNRLYRVYNINDPVVLFPFGLDDPDFLSLSKGPANIDYCHIGIPVDLDQLTKFSIPTTYPNFIVESASDLFIYCFINFISFLHVAHVVDYILQWKCVVYSFITFCKENTFENIARLIVDFLETSTSAIFHSPSTYCRNLSAKASRQS